MSSPRVSVPAASGEPSAKRPRQDSVDAGGSVLAPKPKLKRIEKHRDSALQRWNTTLLDIVWHECVLPSSCNTALPICLDWLLSDFVTELASLRVVICHCMSWQRCRSFV